MCYVRTSTSKERKNFQAKPTKQDLGTSHPDEQSHFFTWEFPPSRSDRANYYTTVYRIMFL